MKHLICWLLGHKPYISYELCENPEPNVYVGPIVRYCGRCWEKLPGDQEHVGDRRIA